MDTPVMTRSHYYNIRGLDYKVTTVCADGAVHFATRDICLGMGWKTIPASLGTYTDEVNRFVHDGKPYLDFEGVKALFNCRAGGDVFKKWVTLTLMPQLEAELAETGEEEPQEGAEDLTARQLQDEDMHPLQVQLIASQTAQNWAQTKLAEVQRLSESMRCAQLFLELSRSCTEGEAPAARAKHKVDVASVLRGSLQKFQEQLVGNPAEDGDEMYLTVEQILAQKGLAQGAVTILNPIFGTDLKRAYVGLHKREPRGIPSDYGHDICIYHKFEDAKLIDASWEVFRSRDKYAETMRRERFDEFLETVRRNITQDGTAPGYKAILAPPRKALVSGPY